MNKKTGFEKFHKDGAKKGAALKEQFKQEKKAQTRERKAFFEQQRADKAARYAAGGGAPAPRFRKPADGDAPAEGRPSARIKKAGAAPSSSRAGAPRRDTGASDRKAGPARGVEKRGYGSGKSDKPSGGFGPKKAAYGDKPSGYAGKSDRTSGPAGPKKSSYGDRPGGYAGKSDKPAGSYGPKKPAYGDKPGGHAGKGGARVERSGAPARSGYRSDERPGGKPPFEKRAAGRSEGPRTGAVKRSGTPHPEREEAPRTAKPKPGAKSAASKGEEQMPLNKFLAHGGVCGRREAADLVKAGKVQVNGAVMTEPGYKVQPNDDVVFSGKKVVPTRHFVYILLNKPKDYLTTTDDPQQRKTVLDLITQATDERVYPVGRLDRNTSGVLLLTNDGDLAQKLTHPSHEIKKVYAVTLDKPLTRTHFDEILKGVPLEDGVANVDALAYADPSDKKQIGIELHTGRNRIVRRIFEHYGYDVKALDRVTFAGLTKKNVNRGTWRLLTEKEVRDLKFFKRGKA